MGRRSFGNIKQMDSGVWRLRWTIPGTDRRGPQESFPTKDLAEARLAQIRLELANEKVFGAKAKVEPITVAEYGHRIANQMRSRRANRNTIRSHEETIKAVAPHIGDILMHRITRENALRYREKFRIGTRGPVMNSTVNQRVRQLSAMFTHAIQDGHAIENPFKGIRSLREKDRPVPWMSYEKRLRYLNALDPDLRYAAEFLLESGMRQGELFRMEKRDVYFDLDPARVLIRESKTEQSRWVALTRRAQDILAEQVATTAQESPYVWPWRHRDDGFGYAWTKSRRRLVALGIEPLWPHAWRHTCATTLSIAGTPVQEIGRFLGNTAKTAERYRKHARGEWDSLAVKALERMRREGEGEGEAGFG